MDSARISKKTYRNKEGKQEGGDKDGFKPKIWVVQV